MILKHVIYSLKYIVLGSCVDIFASISCGTPTLFLVDVFSNITSGFTTKDQEGAY